MTSSGSTPARGCGGVYLVAGADAVGVGGAEAQAEEAAPALVSEIQRREEKVRETDVWATRDSNGIANKRSSWCQIGEKKWIWDI